MNTLARIIGVAALASLVQPGTALAHCDALDGPVVRAARSALAARNVTPVLRLVRPADEAEVKAAFVRTLEVRGLGGSAEALADTWFFETLVRIHRNGEGAPFEGLKPAGHIEPVLVLADDALDRGSADTFVATLTSEIRTTLMERFQRARDAKARANDSVQAGRDFVEAYVQYLHYVEALHNAGRVGEDDHKDGRTR